MLIRLGPRWMYRWDTFDFELCAYEMYWWDERHVEQK